jgi:uncharacterized protein with FMN-binding domain
MKKILLIAGGVLLLLLIGMFLVVTNGLTEGKNVTLNGVSLANVPDGSYTGVYEFKRWTNTVVVQVKDNKITAIDLDKDLAGSDSGEIFRRVIEAQDTKVDTVSGATVTSKAYLKAIENALNDND